MGMGVIKADKGHNQYCGPGALSALTGIDTEQAARLLRHVSGRRYIKGTHRGTMLRALFLLGYDAQPVDFGHRPTLAEWLRHSRDSGAYLVELTTHWCVVTDRRYIDNTRPDGVALSQAPNRRARVDRAWLITMRVRVNVASVIPAPPARKTDNAQARARAEVKRLAALHGLHVERELSIESKPIWVGPGAETDDDPCEGDHYVYCWLEALARVQVYIEHAAKRAAEAAAKPATLADRIRPHLPGRVTQIAWRAGLRRMQVRGAALTLIRRGEARWYRGRLVAVQA
jgi:hypothetical protein